MNTKITALTLAAATAFAFTPKPASAGNNDGAVLAGALIGGLIVGAAIAAADNDCPPVYVNTTSYCPPAPVYVTDSYGYWSTVPVNVWVAPTYVVVNDYYGRPTRRYVAGHYECRNERRWIAHNRPVVHGRVVAGGYGHDRRDDRRDGRRDDRHDNRRDDRRDNRRDRR